MKQNIFSFLTEPLEPTLDDDTVIISRDHEHDGRQQQQQQQLPKPSMSPAEIEENRRLREKDDGKKLLRNILRAFGALARFQAQSMANLGSLGAIPPPPCPEGTHRTSSSLNVCVPM